MNTLIQAIVNIESVRITHAGSWMVRKQYIVLKHMLSEKTASFPKPFPARFPTEFPTRFHARFHAEFPTAFPAEFPAEFPAAFSTEFPKLNANWLVPHHPFQMLNFHQSLPC